MNHKKCRFKLIAYLMAAVMLTVSVSPCVYSVTSSDLKKEKEELERQKKQAEQEKNAAQKELDAANAQASSISGEMAGIKEEIDETDNALVETLGAIDMVKDEIDEINGQIKETTAKYKEAKANEDEQYNAMKLRIRYMYEKGNTTYVQLLIESQGFSDMMNKAEYIEKLYDYDRKLLLKYIDAKEEALKIKGQLEEEESELESAKYELEEEESYLNEILEEKKAEYGDYQVLLNDAKSQVSVFKAQVANKNNAIKNLQAQAELKQKEIDTAIKKEEEERKAAEEAARAAAQSSSSSSGGSSSRSYATGSASTTSSAGGSYRSPSDFGGSTGERIIAYAKQFVGNPYVAGGTSLTQGADCSGFVWRIYKDFGYSIPRLGKRNIGTEVSYENAQPGDIVCYPGHVALYCGDGTIVHASTARTGIKIGSIGYRDWITIRRVI